MTFSQELSETNNLTCYPPAGESYSSLDILASEVQTAVTPDSGDAIQLINLLMEQKFYRLAC